MDIQIIPTNIDDKYYGLVLDVTHALFKSETTFKRMVDEVNNRKPGTTPINIMEIVANMSPGGLLIALRKVFKDGFIMSTINGVEGCLLFKDVVYLEKFIDMIGDANFDNNMADVKETNKSEIYASSKKHSDILHKQRTVEVPGIETYQ